MAAFTAVMTFDIYKFGDKMKKLPNGDDEFHWAGKTVLFMVGGWIWTGWLLVRRVPSLCQFSTLSLTRRRYS
jgi:hypothetical protein